MESALVIVRHLPRDKVGRLFNCVKVKLEKEEINQSYFTHSLEAFFNWDSTSLITIIETGHKIFLYHSNV